MSLRLRHPWRCSASSGGTFGHPVLNDSAPAVADRATAERRGIIDEIVVSNAANLATASAHRTVLSATVGDQNALIAYLLQLDRPVAAPSDVFFSNGFE